MEEICNEALKELSVLCEIHDSQFTLSKHVKQEIMSTKLKEIEKLLEKTPELMSNNAMEIQYNAKIAYILGTCLY